MKVYCVFHDFGCEGEELKHIFFHEKDADAYVDVMQKSGNGFVKREFYILGYDE